MVLDAPLLVRTPTPSADVYSMKGRARLLSSLGIPADRHDPATTKILIVSFGGQAFLRPSRSGSHTPSRPSTPSPNLKDIRPKLNRSPNTWQSGSFVNSSILRHPEKALKLPYTVSKLSIMDDSLITTEASYRATLVIRADSKNGDLNASPKLFTPSPSARGTPTFLPEFDLNLDIPRRPVLRRLATPCHIWVPGAPPALKPRASPPTSPPELPTLRTLSLLSSEAPEDNESQLEYDFDDIIELLPDSSWIAIVCGVSKEQWNDYEDGSNSELPEGFYVAPKYVYMPDLTAVADVLLGKLVNTERYAFFCFITNFVIFRAMELWQNAWIRARLLYMVRRIMLLTVEFSVYSSYDQSLVHSSSKNMVLDFCLIVKALGWSCHDRNTKLGNGRVR